MCCFTCAALLGPLHGRNSCCLWFWQLVFGVSLRDGMSNLPSSPTLSQKEVCSTMGESIRRSSCHNPTLSVNKHVVQICRSSLSAAVQTVQVSVEHHLSTALTDRSVSCFLHRAGALAKGYPLSKLFSKVDPLPFEKEININLVYSSCLKHAN